MKMYEMFRSVAVSFAACLASILGLGPSLAQVHEEGMFQAQPTDAAGTIACTLPDEFRRLGSTDYFARGETTRTTAEDCKGRGGKRADMSGEEREPGHGAGKMPPILKE